MWEVCTMPRKVRKRHPQRCNAACNRASGGNAKTEAQSHICRRRELEMQSLSSWEFRRAVKLADKTQRSRRGQRWRRLSARARPGRDSASTAELAVCIRRSNPGASAPALAQWRVPLCVCSHSSWMSKTADGNSELTGKSPRIRRAGTHPIFELSAQPESKDTRKARESSSA